MVWIVLLGGEIDESRNNFFVEYKEIKDVFRLILCY